MSKYNFRLKSVFTPSFGIYLSNLTTKVPDCYTNEEEFRELAVLLKGKEQIEKLELSVNCFRLFN